MPNNDVQTSNSLQNIRQNQWTMKYRSQFVCLFVLEFYGPVNNEVMSSRSVNSGTVPGQS